MTPYEAYLKGIADRKKERVAPFNDIEKNVKSWFMGYDGEEWENRCKFCYYGRLKLFDDNVMRCSFYDCHNNYPPRHVDSPQENHRTFSPMHKFTLETFQELPPVIMLDNRCTCTCADYCPNGRKGYESRCTLEELKSLDQEAQRRRSWQSGE